MPLEHTPNIRPTRKQHQAWKKLQDNITNYVLFGGGAGSGKILADDGVILTPFGWKKGKDLKVGDLINNPNGSIQKIIQIKPRTVLPCYRVSFKDKTYTDVAADHLWTAWRSSNSRKIKNKEVTGKASAEVVETRKLKEWIEKGEEPFIPVCEPQRFNCNPKENVDRYLLGYYLGDGHSRDKGISISVSDKDLPHLKKKLKKHNFSTVQKITLRLTKETRKKFEKFLKKHGLFKKKSHEKFLPPSLLFDSLKNRWQLIRGLMDSDGYSHPSNNSCEYSTTSKRLAEDVTHLLRSLGAYVTQSEKMGVFNGVTKRKVYRLYIKHPDPDKLFSLKRKQHGFKRDYISKRVTKVEKRGRITGRCITVSDPNGLYITNDFIVTHNSWLICEWLLTNCYFYPGSRWFIGRKELKRLMNSTYLTWMKVCNFHGIPKKDWRLNGQHNFIYFKSGRAKDSRIDLVDLKKQPADPEFQRFGSSEFTGGAIEEAGEVKYMAFDILKSRIGRQLNQRYNLTPKILLTCNPSKNWLYKEFYKRHENGTLPNNYAFIQALYSDNPHTAADYEKQLSEIKDKKTRERLKFGIWEYSDDAGFLMDYDSIADLPNNTPEIDARKYMVVDPAGSGKDKATISVWQGYDWVKLRVLNKCTLETLRLEIKRIAQTEQVPYANILIDSVGLGAHLPERLNGVNGFVGHSKADRNDLFGNLKDECAFLLAQMVKRHEIKVSFEDEGHKEDLFEELEMLKEKDPENDGKKKLEKKSELKASLGRSPDLADNMIMRMWFEINKPKSKVTTLKYKF